MPSISATLVPASCSGCYRSSAPIVAPSARKMNPRSGRRPGAVQSTPGWRQGEMVCLCEREIGFDGGEIGFPAVDGCRAIVLVTGGGLIGYHLNGNLSDTKRDAFAHFINTHVHGNPKRSLYAASRQGGNGPIRTIFHDELKALAQKLAYTGTIYWADLSNVPGSAYVHFQDVGHYTCAITARTWNDPVDNVPGNRQAYAVANRAIANGAAPAQMYSSVDPAGLRAVYPTTV